MTPQEKAEQILDKYYPVTGPFTETKQCALIAVDEILTSTPLKPNNVDWDDCGATHKDYYASQREEAEKYWKEVKNEIEKL